MFTLTPSTFGKFSKLTLKNEKTGEYVSIIPERGATVHELFLLDGGKLRQILDNYATAEELEANHGHKSSILMPYPNRVKNGMYTFQNIEYHLPINKPEEGNAKDGFISSAMFERTNSDLQDSFASVVLLFSYKGAAQGFPFPFLTEVTYMLSETGFSMSTKTTNNGPHALPIGAGWHPYLLANDLEHHQLQLPPVECMLVDHLLPTGETVAYNDFDQPRDIAGVEFDTCLKLITPTKEVTTRLCNPATHTAVEVWQQTGKNKYNFIQLYIPPARNSIAIEPMTAPANAFNNREGLIILEPEEAFRVTCGIRIRPL